MAFPSVHYGNPGDEKLAQSTKIGSLPLGVRMIVGESEYLQGRIGGTAVAATGVGKVYIAATGHLALADTLYAKGLLLNADYAIGATTITMSAGGTTGVTTNLFEDGYMTLASSTGNGGYTHRILSNNSVAADSTLSFIVTLYPTDGLKVAVSSASTRVGLAENIYRACELAPTGTVSHIITGIEVGGTCAASSYTWFAVKGPAPIWTGGTVLRNREPVVCSTALAGQVVPIAIGTGSTAPMLDTRESFETLGWGMLSAAASGYATVYLDIR